MSLRTASAVSILSNAAVGYVHNGLVHLCVSVQPPDEVQVVVVRDAEIIENGVGDLWNESYHISRVSQPVLSASEERSRNIQCRDIILRGRVLNMAKNETLKV